MLLVWKKLVVLQLLQFLHKARFVLQESHVVTSKGKRFRSTMFDAKVKFCFRGVIQPTGAFSEKFGARFLKNVA